MSLSALAAPLSTSRSSTRPRRWASNWALLTALVCLLAQGGGLAHLALVSHVQCYEHDDLIHVDGDMAHQAGSPRAPSDAVTVQGVPDAAHADDHCLAAALRKRDVLNSAPCSTGALAVGPSTDDPPAKAAFHVPSSPVPLLFLAPKSSPPPTV